jgi:exosortase A
MLKRFFAEWRAVPQLTPLLLILLAIPAVFYGTTRSMANIWLINETFTHGFIILPISLWLIWEQRGHISQIGMRADPRALILLVPTLALWLLATLIDVAVVQQVTMVALIPLSVWLVLGLPLFQALLFPLLYLFFAVPLGQSLIPPMMEFTADVTVYLVQQSGVPIYRDGLSFELPTGKWAVVEECSGVRYLIASAALGTIYAYITYRSVTKRALFVLASLIVPIIANGLRAYGIVMIGHLSGMKYAVGADHLLYGWVFFGIVIFILFWIGGFWADASPEQGKSKKPDRETASPIAAPGVLFGSLLIASLLAVNLGMGALKADSGSLPASAAIKLPSMAGNWQKIAMPEQVWGPIFSNPDILVEAEYQRGNESVVLHMGYFHTQRKGAEAISTQNRLSDPYGGDWKLTASRTFKATTITATESELSYGEQKVLVWSGYFIGEQFTASPYIAKLYQAQALLLGQHHAAFVTLSTPFDAPLADLRARLESAWQSLAPPVVSEIASVANAH